MNKYNIKELREKLERCKNISLNEVNPDDVDELSSIKINTIMNPVNRIIDFISKTKNPYIFKVNGKLVKIEFSKNDKSSEESLTNVIKSVYK